MRSDQYDLLKEQCYICSISNATDEDCKVCDRREIIKKYEQGEDIFIETKSAIKTGIDDVVALWDINQDRIYFCKEKHYIFPAERVGVFQKDVLYETLDTDLFYSVYFNERQIQLRSLLKCV